MKSIGIILSIIIVTCFFIPVVQAEDDLLKNVLNISIVTPTPGTATLGSKESMTEFHGMLLDSVDQLMSLFSQIMGLFGLSNMDYTKNIESTFQGGKNQAGPNQGSGSKNSATATPTIAKGLGSISIRTTPGGVQVFLNGQFQGQTPDDQNDPLVISDIETGSYHIELRKSGYVYKDETVQVNGKWCFISRELIRAPVQ